MFIINLLRFFLINKKFYILFQEGIIVNNLSFILVIRLYYL
jgi:hypothetical protein